MTELGHDDSHNDMANGVGSRSEKKKRLSSYSVNEEKGDNTGDELNNVEYTTHVNLHLIVETELFKEGRGVVDELNNLVVSTQRHSIYMFHDENVQR